MAPRDHSGGPWEQQDGHEVVWNRIFIDLGVILGLVYTIFFDFKTLGILFFSGLFLGQLKFRRLGLQIRGLRKEGLAKVNFSHKLFFMNSGAILIVFLEPWGSFFWFIVL